MKRFVILSLLLAFFSCRTGSKSTIVKEINVQEVAVVSANPLASQVGLEILRQGGNAIDAAIAVQFALAVVYPQAGNIGGGGFLLYRQNSDNTYYALDYREKAPAGSSVDMFLDSLGNVIPNKSTAGFLAAGVPGTVEGMDQAFQRFSKLKDWKKLVEPAIKLAKEGFYLTPIQQKELAEKQEDIRKYSPAPNPFTEDIVPNKIFVQEELSRTLEAIRDEGRLGFYSGWVADSLVAAMNANGGIINNLDLLRYKSKWRIPAMTYYKGHRVVTMPPPSSAGILLPQMLEMLSSRNLTSKGFHSPDAIHLIAEVERRSYADRAMHLGDPDFVKIPVYNLLHSQYLVDRMNDFDPNKATPSSAIRGGIFFDESPETTHYSIIDSEGNCVSVTTTLNSAYGSKVVVPGVGFILNNEMDDFSVKPGVPNAYGLVGGEANKILPHKRMLSSMAPTIIDKDGQPFMVLGSPGGSTIPTTVLQVISNVIDHNMDLRSAVDAPRFHHQWLPDQIFVEEGGFDQLTLEELRAKGHTIKERSNIGQVNALKIEANNTITAVGDRRKDNSAAGY